jgi:hypothetical protein
LLPDYSFRKDGENVILFKASVNPAASEVKAGAAFTKYFYNSSAILLRFFYDYSPRVFPSFSTRNPSQPQKEKSFPKFGMHQIFLQFFHKIAVETLFPY